MKKLVIVLFIMGSLSVRAQTGTTNSGTQQKKTMSGQTGTQRDTTGKSMKKMHNNSGTMKHKSKTTQTHAQTNKTDTSRPD
jgi:hypothetical protein